MRFKKGSKVEVRDTKGFPSGCWWPAVIVSGNGHYYSVMHEQYDFDGGDIFAERVPRKTIRPCPPSGLCPDAWVPGDIVEVYEEGLWRLAEVSGVAVRHHYLLRLLGSDHMFQVHASNIRWRLQWKDDRWFVIGKDSVVGHDPNLEGRFPEGSGRASSRHFTGFGGQSMKRGQKEAKSRVAKRLKAFDDDGISKSLVAGNSLWLPEKDNDFSTWKLLKGAIFLRIQIQNVGVL